MSRLVDIDNYLVLENGTIKETSFKQDIQIQNQTLMINEDAKVQIIYKTTEEGTYQFNIEIKDRLHVDLVEMYEASKSCSYTKNIKIRDKLQAFLRDCRRIKNEPAQKGQDRLFLRVPVIFVPWNNFPFRSDCFELFHDATVTNIKYFFWVDLKTKWAKTEAFRLHFFAQCFCCNDEFGRIFLGTDLTK